MMIWKILEEEVEEEVEIVLVQDGVEHVHSNINIKKN
jgi:hypothetical protein